VPSVDRGDILIAYYEPISSAVVALMHIVELNSSVRGRHKVRKKWIIVGVTICYDWMTIRSTRHRKLETERKEEIEEENYGNLTALSKKQSIKAPWLFVRKRTIPTE
jgi:hypothetical protein